MTILAIWILGAAITIAALQPAYNQEQKPTKIGHFLLLILVWPLVVGWIIGESVCTLEQIRKAVQQDSDTTSK